MTGLVAGARLELAEKMAEGTSEAELANRDHQALMAQQDKSALFSDMDSEFWDIFLFCRQFTMTSIERMFALYKAVRHLTVTDTPGSFLECGVWRGGSAMVVACSLVVAGARDRDIFLFDTFEGHTQAPDPVMDVDIFGGSGFDEFKRRQDDGTLETEGWGVVSTVDVAANMARTNYPMDRVHLVKGPIEKTAANYEGGPIALLRIDVDWYEPAKEIFRTLFPRLVKGGILIVDDYGHYKGQRAATDEALKDAPMLLHRIDYSGRIGIKQ